MTQRTQNLILSILLLLLAAYFARTGTEAGYKEAGLTVLAAVTLWRHSGRRRRPEDGGSLADTLPPPGGPAIPMSMFCLAFLIFGACEGPALVIGSNKVERVERLAQVGPLLSADHIAMTAQGSDPIPSGQAGIWVSNATTPNRIQLRASDGTTVAAGQCRDILTGTGAGAAEGNMWYDTTLHRPRYRDNSGIVDFGAAGAPAAHAASHKAGGSDDLLGAPGAIGGTTPAAVTGTAVTATTGFSGPGGSITALNAGNLASGLVAKARGGTGEDNSTGGTANQVWARPDGATGAAAYRALVKADLPASTWSAPNAIGSGTPAAGTFTDLTASGTVSLTAGTLVYAVAVGGCRGALGAATGYASAPGVAWSTTTETVLLVAPRAGTARNMRCYLGTAPGGADTVVVTGRKNAADQTPTMTYTGAESGLKSDTSNTFAVAAGDRIAIKGVSSAGTAADLTCAMEITN